MVKDYKKRMDGLINQESPRANGVKRFKKLGFLALIVVLVFSMILVSLQKRKPEIFVTKYGRLADEFFGKGLLVKTEQVFFAPYAGRVTLLVDDEQRVAVGKPILKLDGRDGEKIFYSETAGIVSFSVDGLENNLHPKILDDFQQNYLEFRGKVIEVVDGERVNAGRPLFKLVDNFQLYLLVQAPEDQIFRYSIGDKVWLNIDHLTIIGWLTKIIKHQNLFVITLERFPNEVIDKRWVDLKVLNDAHTGVYVPRNAITRKENTYGVYRISDQHPVFTKIKLLGGNATEVVVTGIERGVEILANPLDVEKF